MLEEKIRAAFDEMPVRQTRPRRIIVEHLMQLARNQTDFTVDDFWQELREADPRIGRATLYRSIDILVQKGILERIDFIDGTHRYHLRCREDDHHHLTCTSCHRVVAIEFNLTAEKMALLCAQTDFDIEGLSLNFFGRCRLCRTEPS